MLRKGFNQAKGLRNRGKSKKGSDEKGDERSWSREVMKEVIISIMIITREMYDVTI